MSPIAPKLYPSASRRPTPTSSGRAARVTSITGRVTYEIRPQLSPLIGGICPTTCPQSTTYVGLPRQVVDLKRDTHLARAPPPGGGKLDSATISATSPSQRGFACKSPRQTTRKTTANHAKRAQKAIAPVAERPFPPEKAQNRPKSSRRSTSAAESRPSAPASSAQTRPSAHESPSPAPRSSDTPRSSSPDWSPSASSRAARGSSAYRR